MPILIIPIIELAAKVAISTYTLYKIGSTIYEEICDEQ